MAFIEKKDPTILNIKLTSKGRDLLSQGNLNFTYFGVGDSEIDYNDLNYYKPQILRAADKNSNILSFIPSKYDSTIYYNNLITKSSEENIITNTINDIGFFDEASSTILTDSSHTKQSNIQINVDEVNGGNSLNLYQTSEYIVSSPEPAINDILMVKWVNKRGISSSNFIIDINNPTPYLFYKITGITSGSLANNNLVIGIDRELPNFSLVSGSAGIIAGAILFYNKEVYDTDPLNSDDYVSDNILSFIDNFQCDIIKYPFWNMNIIYTEEIAGIGNTNLKYNSFYSSGLTGFLLYIQEQAAIYKKIGVIHYTNSSPNNTYGEGFYHNTAVLNIPTIMWHRSSSPTLGLILSGDTVQKILAKLNTPYYDLIDTTGYVVGKIFNNLKIFVIEDQDLLYAMSLKSNRNWTLPPVTINIGGNYNYCNPPFITTTSTTLFAPTTTSTTVAPTTTTSTTLIQ